MKEHVVTPFGRVVRKLEEDFKNSRKLLTAVGDENRQHLLCVMLNCPVEGARVTEITEMTHLSRPAVLTGYRIYLQSFRRTTRGLIWNSFWETTRKWKYRDR